MASEKQRRCFTFMVIPHSEEATFSLKIPLYAVQIAAVGLTLAAVGFSFLGYSYLKAAAEASQLEHLRQLNRAQQEEIDALAIETEQAMNEIEELDYLIENITKKIDDVEILEDMDSLQKKVQENRTYLFSAEVALPERESTPSNSFNSAVTYNYQTIPEHPEPNYSITKDVSALSSTSGLVLERAIDNLTTLHYIIPEQLDTLDKVEDYIGKIESKLEEIESKPSLWPARGRITSGFGARNIPYGSGYQFHTGVDIAGSHGSRIRAAAQGEVSFSGYRGSLGNLLIIDHGYGYKTYYAHLANFAVSKGDRVEKGETIGYMGASGRTTGTHLHYEVHYKGSPVNPVRYMEEH